MSVSRLNWCLFDEFTLSRLSENTGKKIFPDLRNHKQNCNFIRSKILTCCKNHLQKSCLNAPAVHTIEFSCVL